MEKIETDFDGLYILKRSMFKDNRGEFIKHFSEECFRQNSLDTDFKESYYSVSKKGVLRGMHFQLPPYEHTKLVYVSSGKILDVVVDIRLHSSTFGLFFKIVLSSKKSSFLYIPKGFAHGFLCLEDNTRVHYLQTSVYSKNHDSGILYDSFGFNWLEESSKYEVKNLIISQRDLSFESLKDFKLKKVF
ncbi:dTDP-4-dehydrorhamnose 3,5-epimerase family protein [Helicobacter canadensis]|uniref:dTDP-4-dehydrorhamnose 3,5-epimerase n=1 Tax=Helicobacter canadensis MIT 98-5491 TaxID=537970 RepID=C5ZW66_9HELI|nr:dTDP-4-dehydrorhamnose 3,5-epimerase family protein [Helicobacter canadensis]EES88887.1 dTDP-4-dehydrorhamnose 3,5-epimerase [Helicobacter canadensis MIT 98-5491]EFR48806.1 putative dTDP-4-dehydrorhamnose 3,5-epimerase [Helicobacter canadensis MIT 98-5491]STP00157.1 dTDP-4-dehydrorhamnose 3,5-epimerase [Helicobacter canadensis]